MPVGVVAGDSPAEPDDGLYTQKVLEDLFVLLPAESRIADLYLGIEETLLRGQQRPGAVHIDGAPFEHHLPLLVRRFQPFASGRFGQQARNLSIVPPVGIFGPAVEKEPDGAGTLAPLHKERSGIAHPAAIRLRNNEFDAAQVHMGAFQMPFGLRLLRLGLDDDAHPLTRDDLPDDLGIHPGDRREFSGPVLLLMGPAEDGGAVGFPFSGHPPLSGVVHRFSSKNRSVISP